MPVEDDSRPGHPIGVALLPKQPGGVALLPLSGAGCASPAWMEELKKKNKEKKEQSEKKENEGGKSQMLRT